MNPQTRGFRTLQFIDSWSEVTGGPLGTCDWHLKWRQSCGTEPFPCGVCTNVGVGVRAELNCLDTQLVWENQRTGSWYEKKHTV